MPNMSYCRYQNTSYDMQDVVDALYDYHENLFPLSKEELRGLDNILALAKDIVDMEDKITNILDDNS